MIYFFFRHRQRVRFVCYLQQETGERFRGFRYGLTGNGGLQEAAKADDRDDGGTRNAGAKHDGGSNEIITISVRDKCGK